MVSEIEEGAHRPEAATPPDLSSIESGGDQAAQEELGRALRDFAEAEAIVHIDDLLLRRGTWGEDPARSRAMATEICRLLGWDESRTNTETTRLE